MDHDYIETHDISSRYVAGRLPDGEEREFEAHLVDCPQCLDAVESEMSLREGLRIVGSQSAPQLAAPAAPPASMATRAYPFFGQQPRSCWPYRSVSLRGWPDRLAN
jgi:anti-sigma factor RsiW